MGRGRPALRTRLNGNDVVADVRDHGTSRVSVVICAYTTERWARLRAAVNSVLQQSPPPDELLVVIDHNRALEDRAREHLEPRGVKVVASLGPQGLSGARNTGTGFAQGEVVVFLDDDAAAEPGWLAHLVKHYADPVVLGVGGQVVPHWEHGVPAWFPPEFAWVVGCSYTGLPTSTAEVRNPIGASMSFRRTVLERVGGFSSTLGRVGTCPLGCEETDLSIRARQAFPGGAILHEPKAVVHHHVPAARAEVGYFRSRCWSEGMSKAEVRRATPGPGVLGVERSYVTRTLAGAAARNVRDAAQQRCAGPLLQTGMIGLGVLVTVAGYAAGVVRGLPAADARPVRMRRHRALES
jgi:GT2 family glycosyltransferase